MTAENSDVTNICGQECGQECNNMLPYHELSSAYGLDDYRSSIECDEGHRFPDGSTTIELSLINNRWTPEVIPMCLGK